MWWPPFLYPPPASASASAFVAVASVAQFASMAKVGLGELRGEHMAYSKFWQVVAGKKKRDGGRLLPSQQGMLLAYVPALVAAAASFSVPGAVEGTRAQVLSATLTVHFLKRVLQVLFIHQYSGSMPLTTAASISTSYLLIATAMIYTQHLTAGLPDPLLDLLYPGVLFFAVGIAGNFYHHFLLSQLRTTTTKQQGGGVDIKEYKIPTGGLFALVTCPHYLFEIVGFFGFAMIAQTVHALAVASGSAVYLAGRSCATRRWYESKFKDFPKNIKALVPFVL